MESTSLAIRIDGHIQRDTGWAATARRLMSIKKSIEDLERIETDLTNELKKMSQGISSFGEGFKFTQSFRKGSVNYKSIPELQGVDLEIYRTADTEVWKLSLELQP